MEESDVHALRVRIRSMAGWYANQIQSYLEIDDFEQEGWLAILERDQKQYVSNLPALMVARFGMIELLRKILSPGTNKHGKWRRPEERSTDIILESDLRQEINIDDDIVNCVTFAVDILPHLQKMTQREQWIIAGWALGMTLEEIGRNMDFHPVHISRLKKQALRHLLCAVGKRK